MFVQRERPIPDHPTSGQHSGTHRNRHRHRNLPEVHPKRCVSATKTNLLKSLKCYCLFLSEPEPMIVYVNQTSAPDTAVPTNRDIPVYSSAFLSLPPEFYLLKVDFSSCREMRAGERAPLPQTSGALQLHQLPQLHESR
jgi:hypothetical protein